MKLKEWLLKFQIRRVGEESWSTVESESIYEAAETYCESEDENGQAFGPGIDYEVRELGSSKIQTVKVTASVSYSAYDLEEGL